MWNTTLVESDVLQSQCCSQLADGKRPAEGKTARLQFLYQDSPLFGVRRLLMRSEIVTRCSNLHIRWLIRVQLSRTRSKRVRKSWIEFSWSSVSADPSWGFWPSWDEETRCLQLYYIYRVLRPVTGETLSRSSQRRFSTYKFMQIYVWKTHKTSIPTHDPMLFFFKLFR